MNPSNFSRRIFLKTTAAGGAALAAAPVWGRPLGANDRINVGFIGLGDRGSEHLNLVLQHRANKPDVEVVALCDVYQKRLNMAASKAPSAKTYVHHQEVSAALRHRCGFHRHARPLACSDHAGRHGEWQGRLRREAYDAHGRGEQSGCAQGEGT